MTREEERIRKQHVLDIEAFGKDAEALGVDLSASAAYKNLDLPGTRKYQ